MNNLRYVSTEELEQELERRKSIPPKPQLLKHHDIYEVKDSRIEYIELVDKGYIEDLSNSEHFIFERAIECIYGSNVWDWISLKLT